VAHCEFGLLTKRNGIFSVKSLTLSFLCIYSVLDNGYSFCDIAPCWLVISVTFGGSWSPHLQHSRIITFWNVLCTEAEFWERDFLIKVCSPLWLRDSNMRRRVWHCVCQEHGHRIIVWLRILCSEIEIFDCRSPGIVCYNSASHSDVFSQLFISCRPVCADAMLRYRTMGTGVRKMLLIFLHTIFRVEIWDVLVSQRVTSGESVKGRNASETCGCMGG